MPPSDRFGVKATLRLALAPLELRTTSAVVEQLQELQSRAIKEKHVSS
jgi:hypothetical protein